MNENLPEIKKDSLFLKIKRWFSKLFLKQDASEQYSGNTQIMNNDEKINFKNSLQAEDNSRILFLQRKLKEKSIQIKDLTDKELDDVIELFKKNIEDKKNKILKYRKG